ncbi:MAG: hypothetical protein HYZ44_15060 [Bacteroidetes bacterium]|nr:hypothetical protein [Bacteroidota bacterium]
MRILFVALVCLLMACGGKKTESADAEVKEWPDMDSFHMIMAESFHPYKDSANLAPAKGLAKEMADAASKWAAAQLPEKVNNDDMKGKLQKLNDGSQSLLKLITDNAADSLIGQSLTNLHSTFHEIQEGWYGGGKEEEKEHH